MSSAMAKRLEGKTIVVTGASSGIGCSVAKEFARTSPKNLKIVLTARRVDTLKEVAADINKEVGDGVKVLSVKLDISKPEEVKAFVSNLPEEFKDIDVLVNNAGLVKGMAKAPEILPEDIDIMFSHKCDWLDQHDSGCHADNEEERRRWARRHHQYWKYCRTGRVSRGEHLLCDESSLYGHSPIHYEGN